MFHLYERLMDLDCFLEWSSCDLFPLLCTMRVNCIAPACALLLRLFIAQWDTWKVVPRVGCACVCCVLETATILRIIVFLLAGFRECAFFLSRCV